MVYYVAIVGRPNVGKSTLFNRLAGKRLALVDDTPGVTRDRRTAVARFGRGNIHLIDTAGLEEAKSGSIEGRMRVQTNEAIKDASLVVFVMDARVGLTPSDEEFARIARASGKPVVLVANKSEGRAAEPGFYESYSLGLGEPLAISAEHGDNIGELETLIQELINLDETGDSVQQETGEIDSERPLRIAIIGRPNSGKSTLFNKLVGSERMITGPEAGLTRDSVAVDFEWQNLSVKLFDTAGLRRKAKVHDDVEKLSVGDALRAIRFAEVVILLLEADRALEKQDLQIADLVHDEGRALVIGINKWDIVEHKQQRIIELRKQVEHLLPQLSGIAVIPVSAKSGSGLDRLRVAVETVYATWNKRVATSALNRFLSAAVERHPPPAPAGRRIRLRYMTQSNARPPTFVVFCSKPEALPASYVRYIVNGLRESFDFSAVPIRLNMRKGKNPYAGDR